MKLLYPYEKRKYGEDRIWCRWSCMPIASGFLVRDEYQDATLCHCDRLAKVYFQMKNMMDQVGGTSTFLIDDLVYCMSSWPMYRDISFLADAGKYMSYLSLEFGSQHPDLLELMNEVCSF